MSDLAKALAKGAYSYVVQYEEVDGAPRYVASHPELPGCMAQGTTPAEALDALEEAREMVITHLLENGLHVPEPEPLARSGVQESVDSAVVGLSRVVQSDAPEIIELFVRAGQLA